MAGMEWDESQTAFCSVWLREREAWQAASQGEMLGELWVGPWHWGWWAVDRSNETPEKVCVMMIFKTRGVYVWGMYDVQQG